MHYNLGLTLQQLGQRQAAEAALLKAQSVEPRDAGILYALVVFYAQGSQRGQALRWATALQERLPDDPQVRALAERLRAADAVPGALDAAHTRE
ncbi:MAG: hypothetical protein U1F30_16500 [Steroidobacteraceae bacterium]